MTRFKFSLVVVLLVATGSPGLAQSPRPRPAILKPAHSVVTDLHRRDAISVKFRDDLLIRAENGALVDRGSGTLTPTVKAVLAQLGGGRWSATYALTEEKLAALRTTAQGNLRRAVADLRTQFTLTLAPGSNPAAALDALNALDAVEIALPMPRPVAPPTPPNFQANQGYLNAATVGVDAPGMWAGPYFTTGVNSIVVDIEYSWNLSHQDLHPTLLVGPPPVDPFNDNNHGTAVLGEMASVSNGFGTTGICYGVQPADLWVVAANTASGWDVGAAVLTALGAGTPSRMVILLEQQTVGPNYTGNPPDPQFGLVPVEWYLPWYNAIVTATGNGAIVVEAAGNGSQNLDDPIYSVGNGGHWPFLPQNDSGAIIVGAGGPPGSPWGDRSRLTFSNYGATVDLQGWGAGVMTTGYGNAYSAEGPNLYYTNTFNGTSAASPIVAGACALLISYFQAHVGAGPALTPAQVKSLLVQTGSPQLDGQTPASQHIGPRPNVTAAAALLDFTPPQPDPPSFALAPVPVTPTSIQMNATALTDASPPIEYFFQADPNGCGIGHDSGWTSGTNYIDGGLSPNTCYAYRVKARDSALGHANETNYSLGANTATLIQAPAAVQATNVTATSMNASATGALSNLGLGQSAVFFELVPPAPGSQANQWVATTSLILNTLAPNTHYTLRAKARNQNGIETAFTAPLDVTTPGTAVASCDCDGNGFSDPASDAPCFVAVLVGRSHDAGQLARCDMNGDGRVNGADVQPFLACLTGGGGDCGANGASNPAPADDAVGIATSTALSWTPGVGAASSDVYLGTDQSAVMNATPASPEFRGNTTGSSYFPAPPLLADTTYYWRIDSHSGSATCRGLVWSFATASNAEASNPVPTDGATGVLVFTSLSWTAAPGAVEHDVYLGTTQLEVENATPFSPGVYRGRQSGTGYFPGSLSQATTYYWRIDEVSAGQNITHGTVWRFSTIIDVATSPGPSDFATQVGLTDALVGRRDRRVQSRGHLGTDANSVATATTASLEYGSSNTPSFWPGTLSPNTTYFWRIDEVGSDTFARSHGNTWRFTTLAPPNPATSPNPFDFATNVPLFVSLSWIGGFDADNYDIYLGTDLSAVTSATPVSPEYRGNQSSTSYFPPGLMAETTYYWRIDARNQAGATPGPVWRFTTQP
ncbi:MAG: S8 family serine peptidase [Phycisphaerae bacterium]